jgi:hypothetical protein
MPAATVTSVLTSVASFVNEFLSFSGFAGGRQQDAAEGLMEILKGVDAGQMQERCCKSYTRNSVESMILCKVSEDAQVSRDAPPVSMAALLTTALTDEEALDEDPPALILRVENIYEQGENYFSVDASASWDATRLEFTVVGRADSTVEYKVSGYVAHIHDGDGDARQRMSSGHYVAYLHFGETWSIISQQPRRRRGVNRQSLGVCVYSYAYRYSMVLAYKFRRIHVCGIWTYT